MNDRGHNFVWDLANDCAMCQLCKLVYPSFAIKDETIPECAGRPVTTQIPKETFPTTPEDWRRSVR